MAASTTAPRYRGVHRRPGSPLGHLGRAAAALLALSALATLFLDVFMVAAAASMLLAGLSALLWQAWRVRHDSADRTTAS